MRRGSTRRPQQHHDDVWYIVKDFSLGLITFYCGIFSILVSHNGILKNVDFDAKCNQEISIHMVNLNNGSQKWLM